MSTFFLVIIYIAFISLGLPDSLLGSAWPVMNGELSVPLSSAGIISMIITGGTIISSFMSARLIKRFGTGKVTFVSVAMTAIALYGFFAMPSFIWLCVAAIPLGLGAGAVDSALNNFVALHYKAHHMSWLHCFWGIGATLGPVVMSLYLAQQGGWRKGYLTISIIQCALVAVLFFTLPLWKKFENDKIEEVAELKEETIEHPFRLPGVKVALITFFSYCALEMTTGLWGSSYLVNYKGLSVETAARWISLYYMGITIGRFLTGFATMKISNQNLIRIGQVTCLTGAVLLIVPLPIYFSMVGLILIGLGCAPIYPCMLHETPRRFGKAVSQSIMGVQMGVAYMGSTLMPPILGFVASKTSIVILPIFMIIYIVMMTVSSERINQVVKIKE